jgi:hypothetical protein
MRSEEDYGCFVGDVDVILRLCLSVCGGGWASEGKQRSQPLLFSHFCIRATQSIQIHILHMDNSVHALCRSAHAASLYARMIGDIQRIIPIQQFKGERNLKNLPALNGYACANDALLINPLLPTAIWILTSLSLTCKASSIGPKQHGYMLLVLDDAAH